MFEFSRNMHPADVATPVVVSDTTSGDGVLRPRQDTSTKRPAIRYTKRFQTTSQMPDELPPTPPPLTRQRRMTPEDFLALGLIRWPSTVDKPQ
jgi:hypothetical protein